jgi:hypothetical protein
VRVDEAQYVMENLRPPYPQSVGDGKYAVWGQTVAGRFIQVIFAYRSDEEVDIAELSPLDRLRFQEGVRYPCPRFRTIGETTMATKKAVTKKGTKPYWEMTTDELAEATKEFDKPLAPGRMRALTKEERARWERAQKAGKGRNISLVTVALPTPLLDRMSEYARKHDLSISDVMRKSVDSALNFVQ